MSLINDALKEARQEPGDAAVEQGRRQGYHGSSQRRGGKGLFVLAVLAAGFLICLLAGAIVGILALSYLKLDRRGEAASMQVRQQPVELAVESTRTPASPAYDAAAGMPAATPPPEPAVARPQPKPPEPQPQPVPPQSATPVPPTVRKPPEPPTLRPPSPAPAPPAEQPDKILDATEEVRAKFELKGIMKGRRGNMALINSRIVREGDRLSQDAAVVEISDTDVVVRYGGTRYRMIYTP